MIRILSKCFSKLPGRSIFWVSLGLSATVFACDCFSGPEISFSVFYLVPVCIITWYTGGARGLGMAVLCAGMWLLADTSSGHRYAHALIPYASPGGL